MNAVASPTNNKSTLMRAFNNHFFDFMADIINIVPENNDLPVSRDSFMMIKKANPTAIIKAWYLHIYSPYNHVIEGGDITFFFDKDYSEDISHLSNADSIMQIIDTLRKPIREMGEVNKAHSMKYIQNLTELSRAYTEA
uniref:Uncharacterized protein n=1 Tax=viral metagenome TaxID=1070528 RepID=A0A6C0B795_9ZZZZ